MDTDLSKLEASKAGEGERSTYRKGNSSGPGSNQRQVRPQRSFEVDRSRRRSQSSTRSATEQRDTRHGNGHMHGYAYGTQLPPIPASPYATEDSSPPSPDSKRASRAALANIGAKRSSPNGKEKEKDERNRGKERETVQSNGEVTPPRNQRKSSTFVPYRSPPPQSLDAAAELLAHYPNGQGAQSPSDNALARRRAGSPATTASTPSSPTEAHLSFMPQASSSPARGQDGLGEGLGRPSFSLSISVEKGPISLPGLASPGGKFGSLGFGKGKEKDHGLSALQGFGVPQLPRRSMSSPPEQVIDKLPIPPVMGRRNTSGIQPGSIRTQNISTPILDAGESSCSVDQSDDLTIS